MICTGTTARPGLRSGVRIEHMNMLKFEIRNPKSERNPNADFRNGIAGLAGSPPIHAPQPRKPVCSDFGFRISSGFLPSVCGFFSLLFVAFFAPGIQAADNPPPGRYLLVFETSPVLKKNLSGLRQNLGKLFSSN